MEKDTLSKTLSIDKLFVGRKKVLRLLSHHLEKTINYNGSFVLIQGEIGIGKTKLLNHFIEKIKKKNINILSGKIIQEEGKPFSAFVQMIENFIINHENCNRLLARLLEPEIAPSILHYAHGLKKHYPVEIPYLLESVDNSTFYYSFQCFLENLSRSKPVVFALDDLQWIKEESMELLKYIVKRLTNQPILLVATTRFYKNNKPLQRIINEFNIERLITRITLENFSRVETAHMLLQIFENKFPKHFTNWIFSITKGNPLFIKEILKTLIRQNIIYHDTANNKWSVEKDYEDFPIPETLENIVSYRLDKLSTPELNILKGASVIGERFSFKLLRKLFDSMPKKQFLRSYNILVASGLIKDSGEKKQFHHPLIHELLYHRTKINERRKLHRKLAKLLESINGSDEEIAFHLTQNLLPSEETEKLACYLFNVSRDLLSNYNYRIGREYLKIAKRIADKIKLENKQKMKIKTELNHVSWILGSNDIMSSEKAKLFVKELVNIGLKKEAAIHYRMLFHHALSNRNLEIAEKYLKKGICLVNKNDAFYWRLRVEHCLLQRRKGFLTESEQEAKTLIEKIPQEKAPKALYKVFTNLGLVSYMKGDLKEANQYLSQALSVVEKHRLLLYTADSYTNLGLIDMQMGKLDSAFEKFNKAIKKAELFPKESIIGINLLYVGYYFLFKGKYKQAINFFNQTEEKAKQTHNSRLIFVAQKIKAQVFVELNNLEKAESIVKEIKEDKLDRGTYCDLQLVKSLIYLNKGELDLAMKFAEKSLKLAKKAQSGLRVANALGKKSLVLLKKQHRDEALKYFEDAKNILTSSGAIPLLSNLLTNFGLTIGERKGEIIFIEGLKKLFEMNATEKINNLCEDMKRKGFNKALKFVSKRMSDFSVSKIQISTFGGLSVRKPDKLELVTSKKWKSRKSQELLALLIIQPTSQGTTREILSSYFWPEETKKKSQANFRVILNHLKKVIGKEIIIQKGPFVALDRELVNVDCWRFELLFNEWKKLKQDGKLHPAEDRARKAINLYKGIFLPEFYSQPIVDKKRVLEGAVRNILFWLARRCMERVEWREAIFSAQRILFLDSCDEQACQIIMKCMNNLGDRIGAIRQFEHLKKNLKEELDTDPSPETIQLYKKITEQD
jgi:two-component SAPR family response regulator